MRKYTLTSSVWNFYDKAKHGAKCKECNHVIACVGNTSNLMKHLRRKHKHVFQSPLFKQPPKQQKVVAEYEEAENDGEAHSDEETSEAVTEANAAVHTIQAYRDVNGTTFLYLQPAPEGEQTVQIQNASFTTSEAITSNGEVVSVAIPKDASVIEGQVVEDEAKTQEATPRKLVHAPVKNFQGSSTASKAFIRQVQRSSPVKTSNSSNSSKDDSYDAFGKYVASMLRTLAPKTACRLQGEIVNWILKEKMKTNS